MEKILIILQQMRPEFDYTNSQDFIQDGYLDSFDLVALVSNLEKEYHIKIKGVDIVPENFCNIVAIKNLLEKSGVKTDEI